MGKTNKNYCRVYRQKKGNLYKTNEATRKRAEREKKKLFETEKYNEFKKKEAARVKEYPLKKKLRT